MNDLGFGLQVSLLGFTTVVITLFMLYAVLILFTRVFHREPNTLPADRGANDGGTGISRRKIAAMTAAVYSYLELTGSPERPVAIKIERAKTATGNSWTSAGRRLMLEGRLELERFRRKNNDEKI